MDDEQDWMEPPTLEDVKNLPLCMPDNFTDAPELADQIERGEAFVLNLDQIPLDTARRILDFLCGAAYLARATIQRIALNTYIVTPPKH